MPSFKVARRDQYKDTFTYFYHSFVKGEQHDTYTAGQLTFIGVKSLLTTIILNAVVYFVYEGWGIIVYQNYPDFWIKHQLQYLFVIIGEIVRICCSNSCIIYILQRR